MFTPDQHIPPAVHKLADHLIAQGGSPYLVGGCVRDIHLGVQPIDFDIEIYHINPDTLEKLLGKIGPCKTVGKSFGIFKVWVDELEIDVALPRKEWKTAAGHQGFDVVSDPDLSPETAARRRDFTINAMMWDFKNETLLDFFDGQDDLRQRCLRHVSPAFAEDPLRVLRGMQFASRFGLFLHPETAALCQTMLAEAEALSKERIWGEWEKWTLAGLPSYGLQVLDESGWIKLYPGLEKLKDCPQNPKWHPEGDVWVHTRLVTDQMSRIGIQRKFPAKIATPLMLAALTHDMGKPDTTRTGEDGQLHSHRHEHQGLVHIRPFLKQIGAPGKYTALIEQLVQEHIAHLHGKMTDRAIRRLAQRLQPATIEQWEALVEADSSGRSPLPVSRPAEEWLKRARELELQHQPPAAIVTGKMLIDLGVSEGPQVGKYLARAFEAQLDGEINHSEDAIQWLKGHIINK